MKHKALVVAIPMKDPVLAKSRLSASIPQAQRQQLAIGLFQHTLAFFRDTYPTLPCLVITASLEVRSIAHSFGANALDEKTESGLNNAANLASGWAKKNQFQALLIIPADIPVLDKTEIDELLQWGKQYPVVIAESIHGGTNALLVSPPDGLAFQYGQYSANKHAAFAKLHQLNYHQLQYKHLSQDIDTLPDLIALSSYLPEDCRWQPAAITLLKQSYQSESAPTR